MAAANHKISIKNLGPIKEITDFEIANFNVVIGESASGKSLLAKAIYMFNELRLASSFARGEDEIKNALYGNVKFLFVAYTNYEIRYEYSAEYSIKLHNINGELKADLSPKLSKLAEASARELQNIDNTEREEMLSARWSEFANAKGAERVEKLDKIMNEIDEKLMSSAPPQAANDLQLSLTQKLGLQATWFIPASRSFVSDFDNLRLTYFSSPVYANSANIGVPETDKTLAEFSNNYRAALQYFEKLEHHLMRGIVQKVGDTNSAQVFLTTDSQRLHISETSSGQRNLFPILLILGYWERVGVSGMIFIEEPEESIHPSDQKAILDEIIGFANRTKSQVFITTHSPYILMSLNNLIEAHARKYEPLRDLSVYVKKVNVQILENGTSSSIIDEEEKLIDIEYISRIQDKIMDEFDTILNGKN